MAITVGCFLLLFDIMERIESTDFSPKPSLFPTLVTWPISQEENVCGSYIALNWLNFPVQ